MSNMKPQTPQFKHSVETREGRIERAIAVMRDSRGFVQDKWQFLRSKGMSDTEILEALNIAGDGELLRAAGID